MQDKTRQGKKEDFINYTIVDYFNYTIVNLAMNYLNSYKYSLF